MGLCLSESASSTEQLRNEMKHTREEFQKQTEYMSPKIEKIVPTLNSMPPVKVEELEIKLQQANESEKSLKKQLEDHRARIAPLCNLYPEIYW